MGYLWLSLFPLLPLFQKKTFIQYILLLAILLFVINGFKRGAILVSVVLSVAFILLSFRESASQKRKIAIALLVVFTAIVGFYYINVLASSNDYFNYRIGQTVEGNASNREWMYPMFFNAIITQNDTFRFLFGNGADGTLKLFGTYAHQDWLEIGINQGIVGIVFYFIYWCAFFKTCRKAKKIQVKSIYSSLVLVFIAYFLISLFSMSINGMYLFSSSVLGFSMANYNQYYSD